LAANEGAKPGIQVFDSSFKPVQLPNGNGKGDPNFTGNFTLPAGSLPAGFMPYGVRDLSLGDHQPDAHVLFVTYRGPKFQGGAVAVFTNGGTFLGLIDSDTTTGNLQSPWGLAYIGQGLFGDVGGDLLVGNFSSGQIDAYSVTLSPTQASGQFQEQLLNANNATLTIPGLRSIHFGPGLGDSGGTHVGLLFTAGGNGNPSLYGEITPAAYPIPAPPTPPTPPPRGGNGYGHPSGVGRGGNHLIDVVIAQDGTSASSVQAGATFDPVAAIDYSSMASVELSGSSADGSSYSIAGTSAGTSYITNAGFDADALDVVSPILQVFGANLDAIAGPLTINGSSGANHLTMDSEQVGTST
jgi:hypothetical protein